VTSIPAQTVVLRRAFIHAVYYSVDCLLEILDIFVFNLCFANKVKRNNEILAEILELVFM
jgi:hypothetical protein